VIFDHVALPFQQVFGLQAIAAGVFWHDHPVEDGRLGILWAWGNLLILLDAVQPAQVQ